MRKLKLFLVLAFTFTLSGVAYAIPEPTYETAEKLQSTGSKQGTPYRDVKLVRLSNQAQNGTAVVSGDVVKYDTVSDDGISVALVAASADGAIAGIAVTSIQTNDRTVVNSAYDDAGGRNWGWIIVHGPAVAKVSAAGSNSATIGDPFITSNDSGSIATFEISSNDTTTIITNNMKKSVAVGGFFFDTVAVGDTTAEVFVKLE